eukprot:gene8726-8907_t
MTFVEFGICCVKRGLINTQFAGISRDSLHKRRATGGRKKHWRKKKK